MHKQYEIRTAAEMQTLGADIAACFTKACVIYLRGDLGAGKTTLVRGMIQAMGHTDAVKSPTYTIVESYQLNDLAVHHFDLYRLTDPGELEFIGIRDYLTATSIILVEWPDQGAGLLPEADLVIAIKVEGSSRIVSLESFCGAGDEIVKSL